MKSLGYYFFIKEALDITTLVVGSSTSLDNEVIF